MKNKLSDSRYQLFLISLFFSLMLFFLILLFDELGRFAYTYFSSFVLVMFYFLILYYTGKIRGTQSLPFLFLICLGIFSFGRIVGFLFSVKDDYTDTIYSIIGNLYWEKETIKKVHLYYDMFLIVFSWIVCFSKQNKLKQSFSLNPLLEIFFVVFYCTAPITALYYILTALQVRRSGYTSIYNGGLAGFGGFSLLFSVCHLLNDISFYGIISCKIKEKKFIRVSFIYFLLSGIQLLQGSRAAFITLFISLLCLYYHFYRKVLNFKILIIGFVIAIPALELVSQLRVGQSVSDFSFFSSYKSFFWKLSNSINVIPFYLQNRDKLPNNPYPYIFEPLVRIVQVFLHPDVYNSGQSVEMINTRFNLGHQLTFLISPIYYLSGNNLGGNFIAEMAEFGLIGVFLFSLLLSKIIIFIDNKIFGNSYIRFISILICSQIFFIPRGETFFDTYTWTKFSSIYFVLYFISSLMYTKKKIYIKDN